MSFNKRVNCSVMACEGESEKCALGGGGGEGFAAVEYVFPTSKDGNGSPFPTATVFWDVTTYGFADK
jgi:hypothetical protein